MKLLKKIGIFSYIVLSIVCLSMAGAVGYYKNTINEEFTISKGSALIINSFLPVTAEYNGKVLKNCSEINNVGENITVELKLLGVIPVKSADVQIVDETNVAVLGTPFGIKMYTDGVLVTAIATVETQDGALCPSAEADIRVGDYVLSVDGNKIKSNEDLAEIIEDSGGKQLQFVIRRSDKEMSKVLTPAFSKEENLYRAGIWVKDSSAGIGTLTFYSPQTNVVCGLGHAVYDKDTGEILDFSNGQLVNADIVSVVRGASGVPGELKGRLDFGKIADMQANTANGIYGQLCCNIDLSNLTEIAYSNEVKNGQAQILCTVDETGPKAYSCEIKVKELDVNDTTQNLIVEITDDALIQKTGGIVQGMSGSPIIQNGKLIGAVTHVLVDDPTKGYGIFAENMLETTQSVAKEKQLKEAS